MLITRFVTNDGTTLQWCHLSDNVRSFQTSLVGVIIWKDVRMIVIIWVKLNCILYEVRIVALNAFQRHTIFSWMGHNFTTPILYTEYYWIPNEIFTIQCMNKWSFQSHCESTFELWTIFHFIIHPNLLLPPSRWIKLPIQEWHLDSCWKYNYIAFHLFQFPDISYRSWYTPEECSYMMFLINIEFQIEWNPITKNTNSD